MRNKKLFLPFSLLLFSGFSIAQSPDVNYVTGTTQKIQQLIGDWEFQNQSATSNLTNTNYQLTRTDLGVPFRHNGKTYLLFGDSQGGHTGDLDCVAYTTDLNPDDGLALTFLTDINGIWNPITIPGVNKGTFNVPTEGVSSNGKIYLYSTTGTMTQSLVSVSNDNGYTYQKLYNWSNTHFINVSIVETDLSKWKGFPLPSGQGLAMFGSGTYRASDVFLSFQNINSIGTANGILYFAGLNGRGTPMWAPLESDAVALFNQPCAGELSVTYNQFIKKWLLTYNCDNPAGTNFRTADNPWGPWSEPKVLFNGWTDNGYCHFMHVDWNNQNCDNAFDAGREYEWGGDYGPYQFPEYATSTDSATNSTIYFTQSTWNPYTVILMKSKLQLATDTLDVNAPSCASSSYAVTLNWTGSGAGWFVDISTDPHFATFENKNVSGLSSASAPAGFSGGLTLQPGTRYYWRLWNGSTQTYGTSFTVPDCNSTFSDVQIINPSCANTSYSDTIKWSGSGTNRWIDISTDSTFTTFSNKNVDNITSTIAPAGFSAGLTLQPNTTYYCRLWNGNAWIYPPSFVVPNCVTGVAEENLMPEISVYPTLSSGTFHINSSAKIKKVETFNIVGDKIPETVFLQGTNTIHLNAENGLYFLHIVTEKVEVIRKIIVSK